MKTTGLLLAIMVVLILVVFPVNCREAVISVLDFQTNNISEQDMKIIISLLSVSIFDTGMYTVIDISQRDNILKELKFSLSGCSDESCQLEAGKMLSAELIVAGDLAKVGTRYILNARMLETETGETVKTARGIYENMDLLVDDIPGFARRLAAGGKERGEVVPENDVLTSSGDDLSSGDRLSGSSSEDITTGETEAEVVEEEAAEERTVLPESEKKEREDLFARVGGFPPKGDLYSWISFFTGAALSGTGIILYIAAVNFKQDTLDPSYDFYIDDSVTDYGGSTAEEYYDGLWDDYQDNLSDFRTKLITASCFTGVGIGTLILSRYLFIRYNEKLDGDVSFQLLPGTEGETRALLSCSLRF